MNILFVHDHILRELDGDFYSTGGLTEEIMHRYLIQQDDKIILITRQRKVKKSEKNRLIKVNGTNVKCRPSNIYYSPRDLIKKRQIVRREISPAVNNADLVIIRLPSFLGFMAYFDAKKKRKKIIIELVTCPLDSFWYHGGTSGKIVAPIIYYLTKVVCRSAENVLYVSEKFLQDRYPTKGKSVACSDVNLQDLDKSIIEYRVKKIKMAKNIYKIGLIGSLDVDFKGHREAILAMKILNNGGYGVELHCLGPGNKERWERFAQKNGVKKLIFFDGTLPAGRKVAKWLDEIDIFIIPSLQEGLPRVLVEAMSRGCPAVGMRTGGIPELIGDEMLCNKKDYGKLAENIETLIKNPKVAEKVARENFNKSKEFMPEKLQQKRKEFFRSIIEGSAQ